MQLLVFLKLVQAVHQNHHYRHHNIIIIIIIIIIVIVIMAIRWMFHMRRALEVRVEKGAATKNYTHAHTYTLTRPQTHAPDLSRCDVRVVPCIMQFLRFRMQK